MRGSAQRNEYAHRVQTKALNRAHYEMIADDEPFYGEVPELQGVWATGNTLEECRARLSAVIEDWLLLSIAKGLPIPLLPDPP